MSTRTAIYAITGNECSALSVGSCTLRHQTPLKGDRTMSELATQFDLHPNQIKQWKDQLLDGVSGVFDDRPKASKAPDIDVKTLHAKIGQLTLENDFLGEALAKAGLLGSAKK